MSDDQFEGWVVVWQRAGHEADIEADLVVSLLEGSSVPVVRIPPSAAPVVFDGFGGPMLPVIVLVPPDRVDDAKELLSDASIDLSGGHVGEE
jgi:hypothetical protein